MNPNELNNYLAGCAMPNGFDPNWSSIRDQYEEALQLERAQRQQVKLTEAGLDELRSRNEDKPKLPPFKQPLTSNPLLLLCPL